MSIAILSPALYSPVDFVVDTLTTVGTTFSFVKVTAFSENDATGKSKKSNSFLLVTLLAVYDALTV